MLRRDPNNILIIIGTVVLVGLKGISSVHACDLQQSHRHFEHGIAYEKKGDAVKALQEFVQALLLTPGDLKARNHFQQILASPESSLGPYQMKFLHIEELVDYIHFVQSQTASLTAGKNCYPELTLTASDHVPDILDDLSRQLTERKNILVAELTKIHKDVPVSSKRLPRPSAEAHDLKRKQNFFRGKISTLKDEVADVSAKIKFLQDAVLASEAKISRLTDQLAAQTLEILEKDQTLARQQDRAQILQESWEEADGRLNLVQRILQERDVQIQMLEKDLRKMQAFTEQYYHLNQGQVAALKSEFAQWQEKFLEQMSINQDKITALEHLLAEQEKKMASLNITLRAKGKRMAELERLTVQKGHALQKANQRMATQDERVMELEGIIQIYKSKLTETNQKLKEQAERIRDWERQTALQEGWER